jgi:hypothetical protein
MLLGVLAVQFRFQLFHPANVVAILPHFAGICRETFPLLQMICRKKPFSAAVCGEDKKKGEIEGFAAICGNSPLN